MTCMSLSGIDARTIEQPGTTLIASTGTSSVGATMLTFLPSAVPRIAIVIFTDSDAPQYSNAYPRSSVLEKRLRLVTPANGSLPPCGAASNAAFFTSTSPCAPGLPVRSALTGPDDDVFCGTNATC